MRFTPPEITANPGFQVRPLEPRDAPRAAALFSDVFGRPMTADEVRWKLFETPAATDVPPAFVAESGGRLVGQYAGTPTRFLAGGRETPGLHGCDVMTAPDFRRRGVLTALGTRAHDAWRDGGIAFVTGLANGAWGSRSAALSWVELFPFRWLISPLRPEAVLARRLGTPRLARLRILGSAWRGRARLLSRRDRTVDVDDVAGAGEEIDDLWEGVRPHLDVSVVRDRAWVEWRYFRSPGTRYRVLLARRAGRPVGYLAYTVPPGGRGVIAEITAAPADGGAYTELLLEACDRMRAEGAVAVATLAVPGSPAWATCCRSGFLRGGEYAFEVVPLGPRVQAADLSDPRRWTLAGGDFDVV